MIVTAIYVLNYILILLFLKSFYTIYFIFLIFLIYFIKISKVKIGRSIVFVYPIIIMTLPFVVDILDDYIYELYLLMDIDMLYTYIGTQVAYYLALLHALVFFFITFRKVGL